MLGKLLSVILCHSFLTMVFSILSLLKLLTPFISSADLLFNKEVFTLPVALSMMIQIAFLLYFPITKSISISPIPNFLTTISSRSSLLILPCIIPLLSLFKPRFRQRFFVSQISIKASTFLFIRPYMLTIKYRKASSLRNQKIFTTYRQSKKMYVNKSIQDIAVSMDISSIYLHPYPHIISCQKDHL